ncbi:TIGR03435 family protein [Granulicella sibirica]|uniref:CHP03435 domain-containing protein n=1 Tax=Granulicella sibirica TaxID=2479048 RepID=A0A4Q0T2W4_9BACT|nr:TIGR03435 family protein [Granulicella sibirica]RXH55846.1 CHP03435 domain-containing protein [Granulicella sibirica]
MSPRSTHPRPVRLATIAVLAIAALSAAPAIHAQETPAPAAITETHAKGDLAGDWQGMLDFGKPTKIVLRITKAEKGWAGKLFIIRDDGAQPINTSTITLDGSAFKLTIDVMGATYEGTLSPDGNTITGTMTGGPKPQPVNFARATKETAWEIPPPPAPPKLMAADADPAFEVATIKPNPSGASQIQGLNVRGRNFTTRNSAVSDLISFAYDVQSKQIVGAPDWVDKDRFDIDAVPDTEGVPNPKQLKTMIKKLLADRFKLTFHMEKRELSAYVLTVDKTGQKLTPTQLTGPLPGLGFRPGDGGLTLGVRNGTLTDFTNFLQTLVLDRPVVDKTGLTGKYDFSFKFTPNDSQFAGHPPPIPAATDTTVAAPSLFEALTQQVGLKLDAEKTPVEVIAIDHVEKYSAN